MDLSREFDRFIDENGNPVLLIRLNKNIQCVCWNDQYGQPKNDCPICFGTGHVYEIEQHLARSVLKSNSASMLTKYRKENVMGQVNIDAKTFYMKKTVLPKHNDLIVECGWNGTKPAIDDYSNIYRIAVPEPLRGNDGQIEYFRITCDSQPVNANLKLVKILSHDYIAIDEV